LAEAITATQVWPVKTNAGFLGRLNADADFACGDVDTGLIARAGDGLTMPPAPDGEELREAAAMLCAFAGDDPWSAALGLRLNAPARAEARVIDDAGKVHVVELTEVENDTPTAQVLSFVDGFARAFKLDQPRGSGLGAASSGTILSPMPGRIIAVDVAAGDTVTKGQKLVTLEAMKMEHSLTAPFDGTVAELNAIPGAQVQVDALLVRVTAAPAPATA
jgi:3-methylcrotonyl-CoA carboxylase alpha subunit